MIRTFLEFLLSHPHEEGTPPLGWFRRLLLRNTGLKQFDAESRQLDALLRSSAIEQRQALATYENAAALTLLPRRQVTRTAARNQKTGHTLAWLSGLAAALALLTLAPNWFQPDAPAVHAGEFSQQLTVVPGEVLRLLTHAAKTSQTQLPQLSPLANFSLPAMPAWEEVALHVESPVRQEIDFWQKGWQEGWQNLRSRLPSHKSSDPS